MDTEFHYYASYLICARAGFTPRDARTVAHASQFIDDNEIIFEIDKDQASYYRNFISQTMDILKPKNTLLRIYPLFHFIPGDPLSDTARRKDGKMHWLNTTPNSDNAVKVFGAALASQNLHRIGVALHGYIDTWAHQNFIGYFDDFNAMKGPLQTATPNVGHADAGHQPDQPALVWRDERLFDERVDNRARFLEAAKHAFFRLAKYVDGGPDAGDPTVRCDELLRDLDEAIGDSDPDNEHASTRIARYRELAETPAYGGEALPEYDKHEWFSAAIDQRVRGLRDHAHPILNSFDPLTDTYTWKDPETYEDSDWYRFQEAVKFHQQDAWNILSASNLRNLRLSELPEW